MKKQLRATIATCALVATLATAESSFRNSLNLGVTLTDGNSETLLANIAALSEAKRDDGNAIRLGIEGSYGESKIDESKETTVENARGFINARTDISPRWFLAINAASQYDKIADIDYRIILGPAIGGHLVKGEKLAVTTEIGPSYIWEKVSSETDNFLVLRIAERLTCQLSETAELWQSAEFLPKTEAFDDFLLNAEIGVSAAMSARTQLRLVLQFSHDSTPGDDIEKNDVTLVAGIGIQL
ncbi:MAG: YdiY family protein [Kiritimatiellia bacterium]